MIGALLVIICLSALAAEPPSAPRRLASEAAAIPRLTWANHKALLAGSVLVAQALTIGALLIGRRRRIKSEALRRESERRERARLEAALEHQQPREEASRVPLPRRAGVDERVRADDAIRQSKALLQGVIDSTPDWIYVKDRQHRFLLVNRSFAEAFQQSPSHMVGRPDTDFIATGFDGIGDGFARLRADDETVFAGRSLHLPYEKFSGVDGLLRVFDTFRGPLADPDGNIYGHLCYSRDVTERYNAAQEQFALEARLRQAQKMELVGQLTGGIAHDFNNILAAIIGYAELAQMLLPGEQMPRPARYIEQILRSGHRAKELVAQLLTFSRGVEPASEGVFIAPIVQEVVTLLGSTLPATILIRTAIPAELPEVALSAIQLHQVLMNLCVNARDALDGRGEVNIRAAMVRLQGKRHCASCHQEFIGSYVMLSVSDNGPGIAPTELPLIFDPFYTTKKVGQGSGLGLSVLHGIVHGAGGHIELLSPPGAGTEFCIYLPARSGNGALSASPPLAGAWVATAGHVMVVDDEPAIVSFMTTLLEHLGYQATGVGSSAEALRQFGKHPELFDLVITDQTMPDMTGVELASAMLTLRPDLPIVLCTGFSHDIDAESARRIGIRKFLTKPVPSRVLADIVAECLGGRSAGT